MGWGPDINLGGLKDLADQGLSRIEDGIDAGKKAVGEGVDWTTDRIGDGLDRVGAEDLADTVEDFGDDLASELGASVREQRLGETEEAGELVHGKPGDIRNTARHLADFQGAFNRVGDGMRGLGSDRWRGEAADAFRAEFAMHPPDWLRAADAFEGAGLALTRYADVVQWAQDQAQRAIELYRTGKKASQDAVEAHNTRVDAYNAAVTADRDPGPVPPPFTDPGAADRRQAHDLLREARRQRDEAAREAQRILQDALEHAPAEPPPTDRMVLNVAGHAVGQAIELTHVAGGVLKGAAGAVNFVRGINPLDLYNLTHPAQYGQNVATTLAGVVSAAANPQRIPGALWDSFKEDPSEGFGRLVPELLGTKGLGAVRTTARVADDVADAAKAAPATPSWGDLAKSTDTVKEKAIHADSVDPATAQKYLDEQFPWLRDLNNTNQPGYTQNCAFNVVTVDRRLDGVEVSAAPRPQAGSIPFKELGVEPSAYTPVKGYDDIVRDLNERGDGARSVVAIIRENNTGHVFNAVKTPDGVVFLDGQTGGLALLEKGTAQIAHIPYK
ncbi:putative T7SS-secreted protein [Streptomyces sp. NPDC059578]|uniref:putative T7SS-secreted protein n=1 Tax=Streptomyces sp. NPDC059578 TaxID=3346874 RepID=UPI0036BEAE7C